MCSVCPSTELWTKGHFENSEIAVGVRSEDSFGDCDLTLGNLANCE